MRSLKPATVLTTSSRTPPPHSPPYQPRPIPTATLWRTTARALSHPLCISTSPPTRAPAQPPPPIPLTSSPTSPTQFPAPARPPPAYHSDPIGHIRTHSDSKTRSHTSPNLPPPSSPHPLSASPPSLLFAHPVPTLHLSRPKSYSAPPSTPQTLFPRPHVPSGPLFHRNTQPACPALLPRLPPALPPSNRPPPSLPANSRPLKPAPAPPSSAPHPPGPPALQRPLHR